MGSRSWTPIADYGLIGDCHSAALISRDGSIDWCCLPRFDSGSCFGRLLGPSGGHCGVRLKGARRGSGESSYVDETLVLETRLRSSEATVRVLDFMAMREGGATDPRHELVRIVECERGSAEVTLEIDPRFDYGAVRPWRRRGGTNAFTAIGGDDGLMIWSDSEMEMDGVGLLVKARIEAEERLRLMVRYVRPHLLSREPVSELDARVADERLEETLAWWKGWVERVSEPGLAREPVVRSTLTLKALTYAPTGAILAAATTSLPETMEGERNWDYRYSWIRDSTLAADSLAEVGCAQEARRFHEFIVRSAAGHADDLQIMYGIGGERRLPEMGLDLEGYRESRPVRMGNGAAEQLQLDVLGEIIDLAWRWHRRGRSPDDDEWRFFSELIDTAARRWREPDRGIWEWRGEPQDFVHSKICCWAALDRGLRLAEECARRAPESRWKRVRGEIRREVEKHGYEEKRGVFLQCYDQPHLDAALLMAPMLGFVEWDDERMVRTADAIREELDANGFIYRHRRDDDLAGQEGAFLPCSFWLAECYARQGRPQEAHDVFNRAMSAAGPLGLFSEEVDPESGELLGNYPQALTHLSHIAASVAIAGGALKESSVAL